MWKEKAKGNVEAGLQIDSGREGPWGEQWGIVGMKHPEMKNRQENRIDKFIMSCLVLYDD